MSIIDELKNQVLIRGTDSPFGKIAFDALSEINSLQAKIDALMLEYCPDEMTKVQMDNWECHQRPSQKRMSDAEIQASRPA